MKIKCKLLLAALAVTGTTLAGILVPCGILLLTVLVSSLKVQYLS